MRAALVVVLVCLATAPAAAAVSVRATIDPARLAVGETADLAVAVEGTQRASTPAIASTGGLTVSYVGPASQMSFVNGRMTASVTHHFSVVATKPGRYAIGPITIEADGSRHDAGTVSLEVVPGGAAAGAGGGDQLVLELDVPRTDVYVGERIPIGVRLLVGAVRVTDLQYPQIPGDGFALEKFPEPAQKREQTERGLMQVVEFRTTLTPLKNGPLVVGPATMPLSLVSQSRRNRGFFGGMFDESRPMQLSSEPVTLNVRPLPSEGRPADFSGAVGQFTFAVTASPLDVATGDPITVRSVVQGEGSLGGVAAPAIPGSPALRVYPVQPSQTDDQRQRVFEQVVIPLADGPTTLPGLRFTYFDPTARAYRTIAPRPIALTVRPSAQAQVAPEVVGGRPVAPAVPTRPETLGRDIVFIKDALGTLRPTGFRWYRTAGWWIALVLPVGLWAFATTGARRRRRLTDDQRYARFTRAGRAAKVAIADARAALGRGDVARGHDAVAAAMRDYLAAKLDLPPGTVGETAPVRLRAAGIDGAVAERVAELFASCEAVRYAPTGAAAADLERALSHADAIVRALERARRIGPARAALAALLMVAAAQALADGSDGPGALFIRANGLYGDEHYADAAAVYERILAGGVESGAVHFNLGNAYLKAGDVGRAVLAYERARRLDPGDPDLRANLDFARELARDVVEPPVVERIVFPLAPHVSTSTLALAAAAVWWAVWLALATGALAPRAAPAARGVAAAAGLALAVVAGSGLYRWWTVERPAFAVVVARDDVSVRSEPTPSATALFVAKPGTTLAVERRREDAALVTARDGRRGWLETSALAPL